jgi:thiol-disulfide isomerase/thioredoxin
MYGLVRRLAVAVVLLVVLGVFVWAGVRNLRERRAQMAAAQVNEVQLTKADPNASMDGMEAPSIRGTVAPGFTLVDLNGKKVSLADYKGHPVVINFWATYCGPCKLEMPWFQEMVNKYQAQGLVVLGLDEDEGVGKDEIAKAAKKVGVSYPILLPDDKVAKAYQLGDYLPETFYIGKDGKVVEQTVGAHTRDELEVDIKKAIGL